MGYLEKEKTEELNRIKKRARNRKSGQPEKSFRLPCKGVRYGSAGYRARPFPVGFRSGL